MKVVNVREEDATSAKDAVRWRQMADATPVRLPCVSLFHYTKVCCILPIFLLEINIYLSLSSKYPTHSM